MQQKEVIDAQTLQRVASFWRGIYRSRDSDSLAQQLARQAK